MPRVRVQIEAEKSKFYDILRLLSRKSIRDELLYLETTGEAHFNDIQRQVKSASRRTVWNDLRELEILGIVEVDSRHTVYQKTKLGSRPHYANQHILTPYGSSLTSIIKRLM